MTTKKLSEMTDELVQGSDLGSLRSEPESRPERRRRWMAEALAEYAASDVEKVVDRWRGFHRAVIIRSQ
jgi:hypothetical protein